MMISLFILIIFQIDPTYCSEAAARRISNDDIATFRAVLDITTWATTWSSKIRNPEAHLAQYKYLKPSIICPEDLPSQGLCLYANEGPSFLSTPWGEVSLFIPGDLKDELASEVFNKFRSNFQLKFITNKAAYHPAFKFYAENLSAPITSEELDLYYHTDTRIFSDWPGRDGLSLYEITEINGKKQPRLYLPETEGYRPRPSTGGSWSDIKDHLGIKIDRRPSYERSGPGPF